MAQRKNLQLLVRNRSEVVFEGEVESVSSRNQVGVFDVLERHANFISLVNEVVVARMVGGEVKEVPVDSGVLRVRQNVVEVYLGIKKEVVGAKDVPHFAKATRGRQEVQEARK